jgi:hypothetical protein
MENLQLNGTGYAGRRSFMKTAAGAVSATAFGAYAAASDTLKVASLVAAGAARLPPWTP